MKEAEHEKKLADAEFYKQSQHFDNNLKLREAVETRRTKSDRTLQSTRTEYAKVAREAEPMLRRISPDETTATNEDERVRKILAAEVKELHLVRYRDLEKELRTLSTKWRDFRDLVNRDLDDFPRKGDLDRLADQVRSMNLRGRQTSVSSDTSRDVDRRIVAQAREVENLKTDLVARMKEMVKEISLLKDRVNSMPKDASSQQSQPIQMGPGTKSDDIANVYTFEVGSHENR
jgi:hypothetical protein